MRSRTLGLLAVGLLAAPMASNSVELYSNLGPADSFSQTTFFIPEWNETPIAWQFIATSTGWATSVDAAIGATGLAWPITVEIALYADSGANTLGSLLESITLESVGIPNPDVTLVTGSLVGTTLLTAGERYWLYGNSPSRLLWVANNTGAFGFNYYNGSYDYYDGTDQADGIVQMMGAFRINGVGRSVPEPGPLALFGLGLVGLVLRRRRKTT